MGNSTGRTSERCVTFANSNTLFSNWAKSFPSKQWLYSSCRWKWCTTFLIFFREFSVRECQRLPTGLLQFVIVVDENNQLQECPTFFLFHLFRLRSAYTLGTGGKSNITFKKTMNMFNCKLIGWQEETSDKSSASKHGATRLNFHFLDKIPWFRRIPKTATVDSLITFTTLFWTQNDVHYAVRLSCFSVINAVTESTRFFSATNTELISLGRDYVKAPVFPTEALKKLKKKNWVRGWISFSSFLIEQSPLSIFLGFSWCSDTGRVLVT